jgi:hypothetical protein
MSQIQNGPSRNLSKIEKFSLPPQLNALKDKRLHQYYPTAIKAEIIEELLQKNTPRVHSSQPPKNAYFPILKLVIL